MNESFSLAICSLSKPRIPQNISISHKDSKISLLHSHSGKQFFPSKDNFGHGTHSMKAVIQKGQKNSRKSFPILPSYLPVIFIILFYMLG